MVVLCHTNHPTHPDLNFGRVVDELLRLTKHMISTPPISVDRCCHLVSSSVYYAPLLRATPTLPPSSYTTVPRDLPHIPMCVIGCSFLTSGVAMTAKISKQERAPEQRFGAWTRVGQRSDYAGARGRCERPSGRQRCYSEF